MRQTTILTNRQEHVNDTRTFKSAVANRPSYPDRSNKLDDFGHLLPALMKHQETIWPALPQTRKLIKKSKNGKELATKRIYWSFMIILFSSKWHKVAAMKRTTQNNLLLERQWLMNHPCV